MILLAIIHTGENLIVDAAARIGLTSRELDKYTVTINAWTPAHGFADNRMRLLEKIMSGLKNAGIKLPGM